MHFLLYMFYYSCLAVARVLSPVTFIHCYNVINLTRKQNLAFFTFTLHVTYTSAEAPSSSVLSIFLCLSLGNSPFQLSAASLAFRDPACDCSSPALLVFCFLGRCDSLCHGTAREPAMHNKARSTGHAETVDTTELRVSGCNRSDLHLKNCRGLPVTALVSIRPT